MGTDIPFPDEKASLKLEEKQNIPVVKSLGKSIQILSMKV